MSQFPDSEQEVKFQEIFEKVNKIDFSVPNPRTHLNESDSREVFLAGKEFGENKVRKSFGICSL